MNQKKSGCCSGHEHLQIGNSMMNFQGNCAHSVQRRARPHDHAPSTLHGKLQLQLHAAHCTALHSTKHRTLCPVGCTQFSVLSEQSSGATKSNPQHVNIKAVHLTGTRCSEEAHCLHTNSTVEVLYSSAASAAYLPRAVSVVCCSLGTPKTILETIDCLEKYGAVPKSAESRASTTREAPATIGERWDHDLSTQNASTVA